MNKNKKYLRKGEMQAMKSVDSVVALVMGVGVAILALILIGVLSGKTYTLQEADIDAIPGITTVTGDTFTFQNGTIDLDNHDINTEGFVVYNNSAPFNVITLGNFSAIDYGSGRLTALINKPEGAAFNGASAAANYTYGSNTIRSSVKNSVVSGFEGLEQTGEMVPLIVLAIVMVIILSLVLGFQGVAGGNRGSGGAL